MTVVVKDAAVCVPASERVFQKVLTWGLGALGFFLLWSTAGTSLAMFLLLILCFLVPHRIWRTRFWREPVIAIGLVLLAYIALRTFVGEGLSGASLGAVNRYHELLMIPLLWALLRLARRPQSFANGLMAGSLVFAALYWLLPFVPRLYEFLHYRRISAGFGFAVCAYLLFEHARLGRLSRPAGYGAALFLAATVIFACDSRTGYVVLLFLLGCASFRAAPQRLQLPAALVMLVIGLMVAAASPSVRMRVAQTQDNIEAAIRGTATNGTNSTTARVELLRSGMEVAHDHWLLGTGWQTYPKAFQLASAERHANTSVVLGAQSTNPHNEYLMQLGAGGLPALLLFTIWLTWPMWRALRELPTGTPWAGAVGCVALAFAVAAMFNSVLLDFVEGHLYGALLAWLLVRRVQKD